MSIVQQTSTLVSDDHLTTLRHQMIETLERVFDVLLFRKGCVMTAPDHHGFTVELSHAVRPTVTLRRTGRTDTICQVRDYYGAIEFVWGQDKGTLTEVNIKDAMGAVIAARTVFHDGGVR